MSRFSGATSRTDLPSNFTSPEVASSKPEMILSNVDLPQPLGPNKQTNSPFSTEKLTFFNASYPFSYVLLRFETSIILLLSPLRGSANIHKI